MKMELIIQSKILKHFTKIFKITLITFLTGSFLPNKVVAQDKIIIGVVVDENGETLPGVNVKIKGEQIATVTGIDGKYSISYKSNSSVLVFSFIGFESKEVTVGSKKQISLTLTPSSIDLNEVIIQTGYGSTRKSDLTGSIASVKVKELQKAPVTSFEDALAGRVAGVQVISGDGQPGDAPNIVIRGNNSINNSNAPLYVIDGFPIEDPNNNAINPQEIESIDILKDASATAIYGSRGANGVIIITTKRGKVGSPVVSYNGFYGLNSVNSQSRVELMNPYQFVKLQTELDENGAAGAYFKGGKTLESFRNVAGVDFQDQLFSVSPFQNHYVSLTGGTQDTRYTASASYTDQQGIIVNSGFKRYQGRASLDQQVNKKLKLGTNITYSSSVANGTQPRSQNNSGGNDVTFNLLYQVWSYRPVTGDLDIEGLTDEFLDPENGPNSGDYRVNPYFSAVNEYRGDFSKTFRGNVYAEYQFTKDLKLRINGSTNLRDNRSERFYNFNTRQGSPLTRSGIENGRNGSINNNERFDFSNENILTYDKKFNKNHRLTATAIFSNQYNKTKSQGFRAIRVPNENLGIYGLGESLSSDSYQSSGGSTYTLLSYAGRLNYQLFGGKYLFTTTFRADGSSKFSDGNKFGYFPSGAFAWRVSEEKFFKKQQIFSSAKLRTSYGVTGNNRVRDFAYTSEIQSNGGGPGGPAFYPIGDQINPETQSYYIFTLGNSDIRWESTGQFDAGLEFGVLRDKVLVEIDYYKKNTYDLLLNANISTSTGYTRIINNIGKVSNEGLEFTVNSQNIRNKNFEWNTNFNISFNKNRIVELADGTDNFTTIVGGAGNTFNKIPGYIAQVGKPISSMFGFKYIGNYQVEDFDIAPNGAYVLKDEVQVGSGSINQSRTSIQPGDPKYKDINGDGLINDDDATIIGNPNPIHLGGINNNFRYKSLDLNVFFQWSYGNETFNANRLYLEGVNRFGFNQLATFENRWTPKNPNNEYPRAAASGLSVYSNRFVEDASFIRLKTVQLGYNLPVNFSKKIGFRSARIYTSAQNLITWTNYSSTDPENSVRGNGLTAGYDFSAYPRALTFTFGLNVSL